MYSKPQILELYLNKVYFGDGLYGAEAAARGYFGKHASELSVAEAATLAGLVNTLRPHEPHGEYFKEQVRLDLVERFGWQRVYQGGLRVYSTIDMPMQIAAEDAVAPQLKTIRQRRAVRAARRAALAKTAAPKPVATTASQDVLQAALIALDPAPGQVRAMVGGRDFNQSRFNRAVQARRQPGSAFKPFVYATALEEGYTPATVIDHLDEPISTVQGAWTPEDEHSAANEMTMRTALRTSSNRAAVRMLQQVGISRTVQYAKQMGIGNR